MGALRLPRLARSLICGDRLRWRYSDVVQPEYFTVITKQMACVWSLGILGGTVALAEATGTNSASTAPATAAVNLLPNGDFQQVTAAGGLAGWTPDQWLTYKVLDDGDGNRFARPAGAAGGGNVRRP